MKTKLAIVASFILAYLFFVITHIPANIAVGWFPLPNNIKLGAISGTAWHPSASAIEVEGLVVNKVEADVSPLSLMLLAPQIEATFGGALLSGPQGNTTAQLSATKQSLIDTNIEIAANDIVPFLPLPIEVEAFGQLQMFIKELTIDQGKCAAAQGQITWQRAAVSALEQDIELGEFSGQLSCQQEKFAITIDRNNKLGLSYVATIDINGKVTGNGFIEPGRDFPQQLKDVLPFIGRPDAQGRYALKL